MPVDTAIQIASLDDILHEIDAPESDYFRVERLLNAASRRIETFTGAFFKKRMVTVVLSGDGGPILDLGGRIASVTSVRYGGDNVAAPITTLAAADYVALIDEGTILYRPGWPIGVRNVEIVAVVGVDPIPHDVVEACFQLVRHWYHDPPGAGGLKSESIGEYEYERFAPEAGGGVDSDVPPEVRALLLPYRRTWFA